MERMARRYRQRRVHAVPAHRKDIGLPASQGRRSQPTHGAVDKSQHVDRDHPGGFRNFGDSRRTRDAPNQVPPSAPGGEMDELTTAEEAELRELLDRLAMRTMGLLQPQYGSPETGPCA